MHVFGADRATIRVAQRFENFAQRHRAFFGEVRVRRGKYLIEIGLGQSVGGRIELGDGRMFLCLERIQVGPARAQPAVVGDQRLDMHLLGRDLKIRLAGARSKRIGLGALRERFDDRSVRHIARRRRPVGRWHVLELVEVTAPAVGDRTRIVQVGLVLLFNIRRIAPEEIRVLL